MNYKAWAQSERRALQPWAGDHGSYLQRPRAGHRFRSGARAEKQGIYCLRTKLGNKFHAAPGEPHIFCFSFFSPFLYTHGLLTSLPPHRTPDSPSVIYRVWACDNAHATNLSAEHIDSWVCHYPLITPLTYLSIQPSWQPTKHHKWQQINSRVYRAHTFSALPPQHKTNRCTEILLQSNVLKPNYSDTSSQNQNFIFSFPEFLFIHQQCYVMRTCLPSL